jgi:pyridinium-3,5-bisthiocarboxylic acid mononucleotide nickel chelatase
MRIGYLECFAGISGDMLMGALVDAGAPIELLQRTAASLALGAELRVSQVNRSGIQATKIDVVVRDQVHEPAPATGPVEHHHHHHHHHDHEQEHKHEHGRSLPQIRALLSTAGLTQHAHELSLSAFSLLARAEGRIHGVPWEEVHFHEVGAIDAIVDIACCAAAADALGVEAWYCSAVNVGSGFVNCAHGRFPVPAPATAELLKDKPVYSAHVEVELATPTGAALLRALGCRFEPTPVMRTQSIGYGAGTRNLERFPNVVRLSIGEVTAGPQTSSQTSPQPNQDKVTVLECAVDDLSPQVLAHTAQLALERGALDVMSAPVTMKKGRLGTLLTLLCKAADAEHLQHLIFRETTTLGIRVREENRVVLAREITPVQTEFGVIHVKAGSFNGEEWNAAPEFEDCRRAAAAYDVPLKTVMQAAIAAWRMRQMGPDPDPAATTLQAGSRS